MYTVVDMTLGLISYKTQFYMIYSTVYSGGLQLVVGFHSVTQKVQGLLPPSAWLREPLMNGQTKNDAYSSYSRVSLPHYFGGPPRSFTVSRSTSSVSTGWCRSLCTCKAPVVHPCSPDGSWH